MPRGRKALTDAQVAEIVASTEPPATIGPRYGVAPSYVRTLRIQGGRKRVDRTKVNAYLRERTARLVAEGKCARCGRDNLIVGGSTCRDCRKKASVYENDPDVAERRLARAELWWESIRFHYLGQRITVRQHGMITAVNAWLAAQRNV